MRRVLIGTPVHDGRPEAWYVHSLVETARLCMRQDIDMRELLVCYDSIVQNARNDLVAAALRHGFDDLILIDADQEWSPEWVPKILSYPVDCVGTAVRKKTDAEELYNVRVPNGAQSLVVDPDTGLWTAPGMVLGTGFLRLSRKAMQALWNASEKYTVLGSKQESAWIFDIRPVNGVLVGEDVHMGQKLNALGIQTWVDPRMTCPHIGVKKYTGDFHAYIQKLWVEQAKQV